MNFSDNILTRQIQYLKMIGPSRAQSFNKIGIRTVKDIMFYFPSKHLDRSTTLSSNEAYRHLMNGYEGELTIIAEVTETETIRAGKREIFKVHFRDENGYLEGVWFQGVKYFSKYFNPGQYYALSGKPQLSKFGNIQFTHPDYDRITDDESSGFNTGKIIPLYPLPKELKDKRIGDFSLRKIIGNAVLDYSHLLPETLPAEIIEQEGLMQLRDAVKNIHFPESHEKLQDSIQRFKYEELFFLELLVALRKHKTKSKNVGQSIIPTSGIVNEFYHNLPFKLTQAQIKVLREIKSDMASVAPMNRLLQGDVGSGKTIVALIAMLIAVDAGYQAVFMAPTEILADQHSKTIINLLKSITLRKISSVLLLGGQKKLFRTNALSQIETNSVDIIIGTHALLEEKVMFNNLGLVIIDEQHRFGVTQRAKLLNKGKTPDVMVMSATPIPRTLSMTLYGDLDLSIINEKPLNRVPIKTFLRGDSKLPAIYQFMIDKIKDGYQSFLVYPLVEESEKLDLKAAENHYKELKQSYFKNINVGLLHGRMNWKEKEEVMLRFLAKEFDILISTTVIEVGIDIPAANIMVINDAHRFGLSQLHQLRGRVGRSDKQSYCILVTKDEITASISGRKINFEYLPASQIEKYKSSIRLQSMVKYNDGFKIAEIDLKLRGPGNIFGIEQSGYPDLKFADITKDYDIILSAKEAAFGIVEKDPALKLVEHTMIRTNLTAHYSESLKYSSIA